MRRHLQDQRGGHRGVEVPERQWTTRTRPSLPTGYLASTTIADPQWANTTVPSGDFAAAIGEMKAEPAGELQVDGSGALIR